jgi:hypothetical protein
MNEDKAILFEQMAERIRAIRDGEFAGAILIVPPGDDPEMALDFLGVESRPNLAHFWNSAKARMDIAHSEASERLMSGDPFARRR